MLNRGLLWVLAILTTFINADIHSIVYRILNHKKIWYGCGWHFNVSRGYYRYILVHYLLVWKKPRNAIAYDIG